MTIFATRITSYIGGSAAKVRLEAGHSINMD